MNSVRLTVLPLIAAGLFAVGESVDGSVAVKLLTELPAYGFLVWFCWYGVARVIPKMQEVFREENKSERTHHREIIDKLVQRQEKDRVATRDVLQDLIQHCAEQRHGKSE